MKAYQVSTLHLDTLYGLVVYPKCSQFCTLMCLDTHILNTVCSMFFQLEPVVYMFCVCVHAFAFLCVHCLHLFECKAAVCTSCMRLTMYVYACVGYELYIGH